MEAPLTLRRPSNWQDFESLCKKLWGEIWNCPEIQKNGRLGQEQSGVDIFGIPFNENEYFGIQCKGKNEYIHSQFSENEIVDEIGKALKFAPPLKKYYLATTAVNDAKIQEFVRKKNIEHKSKGHFEVHLFAWESIVELIDENRHTYDWFVRSQNYKTNKSVSITFLNGLTDIICNPKFKKTVRHFNQKIESSIDPLYLNPMLGLIHQNQRFAGVISMSNPFVTTTNLSYFSVIINIHNTGNDPIEEYKIFLDFVGDIQDLADSNEKDNSFIVKFKNRVSNTYLWSDSMSGKIIPLNNILVGDDSIKSSKIFIKSSSVESDIVIKWKLISRDFKDNGELCIKVLPNIEIDYQTILVEDPWQVKVVHSEIEDFIEDKKSEK